MHFAITDIAVTYFLSCFSVLAEILASDKVDLFPHTLRCGTDKLRPPASPPLSPPPPPLAPSPQAAPLSDAPSVEGNGPGPVYEHKCEYQHV